MDKYSQSTVPCHPNGSRTIAPNPNHNHNPNGGGGGEGGAIVRTPTQTHQITVLKCISHGLMFSLLSKNCEIVEFFIRDNLLRITYLKGTSDCNIVH